MFGQGVSTSVGAQRGDQCIFGVVRKSDEFPDLSDKNWLCDFAFAVDKFSHVNVLNVKLQGKRAVCARHVHKCESLQIQADFILQATFKQIFCSFSHTSHTVRGHPICKEI